MSNIRASSLWPVLVGMSAMLVGAMVLEAAGRTREQRGDIIVISGSTSLGAEEADAEDAPLLGEVLDAKHAQARRLVRRGQFAEATALFEELLITHNNATELLSELGYLQLISGKSRDAEANLRLARERAPGNAWLALTLATASKRNGRDTEAETLYRESLRLRPHYSAAKLALGRFLRQEKRLDEALPLLEEISGTGSNEDRATALTELGRLYLELHRVPAAEESFELAIGRAPASVGVRMAIAHAYLDSGSEEHLAKATEILQRAIQLAPAVAQLQGLLGAVLVERGDVVAGRAAFESSLELDPGYAYTRRRLLRLELDAGAYSQARTHAEKLIASDKESAEFHFLAALVETRDGQTDAARKAYMEAIALAGGDYPEAYMNLGKLERGVKDYDAAIAHYNKALELRPDYKEARNNLGLALLAANRQVEALAVFEGLVAAYPKYAEAWLNLAKGHTAAEHYPEAILALQRALQERPDYSAAQLNLASALRKSGKPKEAVTVYDQIIAQEPRYVSAWYNRGIALEESDDRQEARRSYTEALRIDAEHDLSMKRLARLELRGENYDGALALYTEILDRDPSDAKSRRLRAETRAGEGDSRGCLQDAEIAKKQDPHNSNLEPLFNLCKQPGR